jgi:putative FmdB family regulatory protein
MPLYEYKCASCGETFEIIQKFSDAALEVHEKCGGHVERLISPSALQFKGSGWYVNDYGSGNGKNQPSKDGKNESDKSESNKGESKSNKGESKKEGKSEGSTSSGDSAAKTETKAPATTSSSTSDKKV